jgi:hypothetical protein
MFDLSRDRMVTIPTHEALSDSRPDGAEQVSTLMQLLVKGLRAVQLYLPNNPVYQRAMENLAAAFPPVWEYTDELELTVHETQLLWDGEPVLSQDTKSESVAWLLFKDGVRTLTIHRGAEDEEIGRLMQVMQRARTLEQDAPDDLLTLLWDQDFHHIKYDYVQLGLEDVPPLQKAAEEEPSEPEEVRHQVRQEVTETARPMVVSLDETESTLYFLDDREIEYLKEEIEREYHQDLRGNVLAMLFDLLELQSYSTVRAELLSIVENFIPYLLAVGDFHSVAFILREARVVLKRARELLPEHRQVLDALPWTLSEPQALGQLLQSLDEAAVHPTEEELGELFREFRPEALETVLSWLPRLSNARVKSLLRGAAKRLAQAHPQEVVKALESDDEAVLLEVAQLAGDVKLPPVVPALGALLARAGTDVRRAVTDALAAIATPGAMKALEPAVTDADRDVRVAAARAIGAERYNGAFGAIEAVIGGNALRDADLTEKTAFFETYGLLAGENGLKRLRALLEPRGLLRRREDPQIRACAAMALGRIDTESARAVLERHTDDKDPLVRNAVNRALRQGAP